MGMVGKDKERIVVSILKEDKAKLDKIAEKEDRTLSNLVRVILHDYLVAQDKKNKR